MFCLYGYLEWRQHRSYHNRIHEKAALIFRLNLDNVLKTMAADFFSNPSDYLGSGCGPATKSGAGNGLHVPANAFIYNVSGRSASTYFCSLPVADIDALKSYLTKVLHFQITAVPGAEARFMASSKDNKFKVLFNENDIAISYSLSRANVVDILEDLILHRKMLTGNSALLSPLKSSKAHVSWSGPGTSGKLQFSDGAITAEGSIPISGLGITAKPNVRSDFPDNAVLRGWFSGDLHKLLGNRHINWQGNKINTDSLLCHYGNYMDFYVGGMVSQQENIISYEYDENFEKVAKTVVKDVAVPEISISIDGAAPGMSRYLSATGIINDNTQLNARLFPLFKVFFDDSDPGMMTMNTFQRKIPKAVRRPNPYFLSADINFQAIKKWKNIPVPEQVTKLLSTFTVQAEKLDGQRANLYAELLFVKKDVNSFLQMVRYESCN
ncbi:hypothetical protein PBAL39_03120 [Pedobacter sp. BAL39]|nr:hypothetical protein PBAL39_03120 [Pedobacter sp. BAL39]